MHPPSQSTRHEPGIDWHAFLDRPPIPAAATESLAYLRGASILVTGAGGSIGTALALRLAALQPQKLVLLESSEQAVYRLTSQLDSGTTHGNIVTLLGSVTDPALVEETLATHHPTIIFHAAAHKHVALLEEHPLAAMANNALGTHTLATRAHKHGVERLVLLSTDKAVEPTSILGASKRIAEQITLAHGGIVLRLCNVLGTEGSVVDIFLQQISNREPLPITDPEADRYFITIAEAVALLLNAACAPPVATLLIPHVIQPQRITTLAEYLMAAYSPHANLPLEVIGLRTGDKLHEALHASDEYAVPSQTRGCVQLQFSTHHRQVLNKLMDGLHAALQVRDLKRSLEIVLPLVPDYSPSRRVLEQARRSTQGALQA